MIPMIPMIYGANDPTQIPDAAAWRVYLALWGQPAPHDDAFNSYIASLGLSTADSFAFETALENYANLRNAIIQKGNGQLAIDAADQVDQTADQVNLKATLADAVAQTKAQLSVSMSAAGFSYFNSYLQHEKLHMAISPHDAALVATVANRPIIHATPAHHHQGGAQMTYEYSVYGSMWATSTGPNSGTFYVEWGVEGTTNPCQASCITARHNPQGYGHTGTYVYGPSGSPTNYTNWNFTDSWPYSYGNEYWPNMTGAVGMHCTIGGNFLMDNPFTHSTMDTEIAHTFVILNGINDGTPPVPVVSDCTAATSPPDYNPTQINMSSTYLTGYIGWYIYSSCYRTRKGTPWTCFNNPTTLLNGYNSVPVGGQLTAWSGCTKNPN
jgi:hypothetical protein